uniref:PID domain-containing protein n=1 Tax=Panagrolaimus superbus TaxID=310955 RepID=A0A914YEP1_9BILA
MSKPKEVYQTIKRQISATTTGLMPNTLRKSASNHSALKDPQARWIHPSQALIRGTVEYVVKMLGFTEVSEAKGAHVIRDAIHAIRFQHQVSVSTSNTPQKPHKVEIHINIRGVQVIDFKSKKVLHTHPLHKISFCADDKEDKRVFAYIANNDKNKHMCYLFLSDKNAEQITLTIGEAFDLAFQEYIDKETTKVVPIDDVAKYKQRIEELEAENHALMIENRFLKKQANITTGETPCPPLPESPVPKPPAGFDATVPPFAVAPAVSPLLPPPSLGRRNPAAMSNDPSNPLFGLDLSGPEVGRKLENLHIDKMDNVFDDSFDPRAGEKKENDSHESLKKQISDPKNDDADDLQAMLEKCDLRINEMGGFTNPRLEFGNPGDTNGVKRVEDEYVMPSTSHKHANGNK